MALIDLACSDRIYGRLSFMDGSWHAEGLPPHVSLRFKAMFPKVSKTKVRSFAVKNSPEVCRDLVWFMQRFPLETSAAALALLERGQGRAVELAAFAASVARSDWRPGEAPAFREGRKPYDYQMQAAAVAARLGRLLLVDDVGLGKTISALAAIAERGAFPAAVIVQAHLADQWAEEYVEPFTTMSCHVIKGTKPYDLPWADIYIFRYSNIAGWVDVAATGLFKAVVFDEIQELRHGGATAKGQAAKVFSDHAGMRIGLTATPVYNYGAEIHAVVGYLDEDVLGTPSEFHLEWCIGDRVADPPALGAYLRETGLALRRLESDVARELPPVNTLIHEIAYDEEVVASTSEEAHALALKVVRGGFMERGQAARDLDLLMRHATGVAKARHVASLVRLLVEGGRHVLVGGWHRDVYDIWLRDLADLNPLMFTGSETTAAKRRAKQDFVQGPPRPMFISLRSGAGLDGLQSICSTVVLGELDWSPQVHKQLIGRVRRPGQTRPVDAIYAVTNGGSDPLLVEVLGLKASQASGIVDPFTTVSVGQTDDSRMRKLAEQVLARRVERAA